MGGAAKTTMKGVDASEHTVFAQPRIVTSAAEDQLLHNDPRLASRLTGDRDLD